MDGIRDSFKIAKDNAWIDFYKKENSSIDDNFNFTVIFYQKDLAKQYIKMKKNILGWTHVTLKINNIEKSLDEYFK